MQSSKSQIVLVAYTKTKQIKFKEKYLNINFRIKK